jgi:hypothetical protein
MPKFRPVSEGLEELALAASARVSTTKEKRRMQTTPRQLKPAQDEVQLASHNQDLIEVPKRARLDREAENQRFLQIPQGATQVSVNNL